MAKTTHITQSELCELLDYNPQTGKLFWKARRPDQFVAVKYSPEHCASMWNSRFAGKEAFTASDALGYKKGAIKRINFSAHRVAWCMTYGTFPVGIDHINGVTSDNRLSNLRAAGQKVNGSNTKRRYDNTSGVTGVSWYEVRNKWRARIAEKTIGYFATKDDAIAARKKAETQLGYHPNHGR
jgi:hypothetical protein